MKTFIVTYTEDFGETYHTVLVSANSFTDAYVSVYVTLGKNSAITELFEVI